MIVTVRRTAVSKKAGLRLGDLVLFCEEAQRAGLPPDASIKVIVGWFAQARDIEASGMVARAAFDGNEDGGLR